MKGAPVWRERDVGWIDLKPCALACPDCGGRGVAERRCERGGLDMPEGAWPARGLRLGQGVAPQAPRRESTGAKRRPQTGGAAEERRGDEAAGGPGGQSPKGGAPRPPLGGRAEAEAPTRWCQPKTFISSTAARRETVRVLSGRRVS